MVINEWNCVFMPMELFTEKQFLPLNKIVKQSTLGWYVNRKFISYWQIKSAILNFKIHEQNICNRYSNN